MQLAASVVRPDAANYFIEVFYRISFSFVTAFRFAKSPTFRFPHYRTKSNFHSEGDKLSSGGKKIFQRWKISFPRLENFPPSAGRFLFLRKEKSV